MAGVYSVGWTDTYLAKPMTYEVPKKSSSKGIAIRISVVIATILALYLVAFCAVYEVEDRHSLNATLGDLEQKNGRVINNGLARPGNRGWYSRLGLSRTTDRNITRLFYPLNRVWVRWAIGWW
jgi:hypothetical protein